MSALSLSEIMKEIILGTSDACSMSRLAHRPSDPAYYIEDCRIFQLAVRKKNDKKKNVKQIICGDFCDNFQIIVNHEHIFRMK